MKYQEPTIPHERLMAAVDAIYLAQEEIGIGALPVLPSDLLGAPDQPAAFVDFTAEEIHEATLFLCRMGLLQWRPRQIGRG